MSANPPSPLQRKAGVQPMNPVAWGEDRPPFNPASAAAMEDSHGAPRNTYFSPQGESLGSSISPEEFLHTQAMIQFVAQPALVQVVRTLLEEYPWMTTQVRLLCDQAMQQLVAAAGAAHQQQQAFTPTPHPTQTNPPTAVHPTPPGSSRKLGRRHLGRDEEHDICAVHGNWRPVKHLHYNATARQVECIPGFHCLESNTSNIPTPTKRPSVTEMTAFSTAATHGSIPPSPGHPKGNSSPAMGLAGTQRPHGIGSRGSTPGAAFLNPHTPPPEGAEASPSSPQDPEETRRLEALLSELHKTTET